MLLPSPWLFKRPRALPRAALGTPFPLPPFHKSPKNILSILLILSNTSNALPKIPVQ